MNQSDFFTHLNENPKPVIVDLWAPWCGPCRVMEPAFKQISQKYADQVDIWKINADESPEVLKALSVMGIPTVISFSKGKEILRRTGIQSAEMLDILLDAALHGHKPTIIPPAPLDRFLRVGAGLVLLVLGWINGQSLILFGIAAILLFSAVYDRCPVYRAIASRVTSFFNRSRISDQV
jgi:thioredoxin 1